MKWRLRNQLILNQGVLPQWFPLNRKWGFLGDSITNGSNASNVIYAFPRQSLEHAGTLHNPVSQRIVSGTPGNKSADMLARCAADVPAASITGLVIMAGTNDASDSNAVSAATFAANMTAILALYPGKDIVVVTAPPKAAPSAAEKQRLIDYRTWILANTSLGYRVADAYAALTDGSDILAAAYDSGDGTHPNTLGHFKIAALVGARMLASQPARTSLVGALNASNLIPNGLMSGTLGAGSPSGWFGALGTGTAATISKELVPAGGVGQAQRVTLAAAADSANRRGATVNAGGWAVGNKLLMVGKAKVIDTSGDFEAKTAAATTATMSMKLQNGSSGIDFMSDPPSSSCPSREMAISYTVAGGVTVISAHTQLSVPNGSSYAADFYEFGVFNLTALGLANSILV